MKNTFSALALVCLCAALEAAGGAPAPTNDVDRLKALLESPRLRPYEKAKYGAALKHAKDAERDVKFGIGMIRRLERAQVEPCESEEGKPWWIPRHEKKLREIAALKGGKVDIVFLGDSISHNWEGWGDADGPGAKVLAQIRRKYTALVLGFGGDRTFNVMWRIRHGELDGYEARFVSLLVGCNNWTDNTPEETVADIRRIIGEIRARQPKAKILLMPLLPRDEQWYPANELDPGNVFKARKNDEVNDMLAKIPDGERIIWFDLRPYFRGAPKFLMPDRLHPNHDGYVIWWNKLKPYLEEPAGEYRKTAIEDEPFQMPPIREFVYPGRDFPITDFGARADGSKCTGAIAKAIEACSAAGGGRVVVPAGTWLTGKVHLRSNVNLHLSEGAVLEFSDEKADYLPAVHTTWEGVECWNTSPLVYAYDCDNVAVTGPGTLKARTEGWYARAEPREDTPAGREHHKVMEHAWRTQYMWGSTNAPVSARRLLEACPKAELRPQFIQINRCRNVRLEGFKLRQSPFWCVHLYMSENVVARNLDLCARKHNNDGFDIDMTRNVLIENCTLDTGDDGFCMKAGRNQDAWRLATPTENVVVRNCHVKFAQTLLAIGSELSGGVRNVSLHDCTADDTYLVFFAKSNFRRGGVVRDIFMRNVEAGRTFKVAAVDTNIFYQYAKFPTFERRPTEFSGIHVSDVHCKEAHTCIDVMGYPDRKIRDLSFRNVTVDKLSRRVVAGPWDYTLKEEDAFRAVDIQNAEGVSLDNVKCL